MTSYIESNLLGLSNKNIHNGILSYIKMEICATSKNLSLSVSNK